MTDPTLLILEDPAEALSERIAAVATAGGDIVLTGGSTTKAYTRAIGLGADWSATRLWWGDERCGAPDDERCVAPDDERSNFRGAKEALLDRIQPTPRFVRIPAEQGSEAGAKLFES